MEKDGNYFNKLWNVGATQAHYHCEGKRFWVLKKFPGALFDKHGYILFKTKRDFLRSCRSHINPKETHISILEPGISKFSAYVRRVGSKNKTVASFSSLFPDVDFHGPLAAIEGNKHLVTHFERERDRSIVRKKKESVELLNCEVCGFSFKDFYGEAATDYCEVHHIIPIAEVEGNTKIRLKDLAIVCANCHRVIHLKTPPYTINDVRHMINGKPREVKQGHKPIHKNTHAKM